MRINFKNKSLRPTILLQPSSIHYQPQETSNLATNLLFLKTCRYLAHLETKKRSETLVKGSLGTVKKKYKSSKFEYIFARDKTNLDIFG